MQVEKLRSLIRESISEYIKEIDEAAETAAMEARIGKCKEAIQVREEKLNSISESDHKELMDENKIKGLENEIKELKKAQLKFERLAEKRAAKLAGKGKKEKDEKMVTDAVTEEDTPVDETDVMEKMELEGDMPKEEALNESFLKMQKLAGVITEAQYNVKKKALIENQVNESKFVELIKKVFTSPSKDKENKPIETSAEVKSVAQDAAAIEKKIADEAKKKAQEEELKKFNDFLYKNQVLQDKLESYLKVVRDIDSEIWYMEAHFGRAGVADGFQPSKEQKQILDDFFNYVKKIGLDGSIINSLTRSLGNELPKAKAAVLKRYTM